MVIFRSVFVAAMIQCLSLLLVCLLFAPGTRAVPGIFDNRFEVLDAVPNPQSGKGSGLGTGLGSEVEANHNAAVDAAVSSSSLSAATATASASAAPSQASSTSGASGVSVPAALLFGTAASAVFLVF